MIGEDYLNIRARLGTALFSLQSLAGDLREPLEAVATLQQLQQSLREPFLFVVVGEVKAGKSSLLNALFGRDFCKVDVLPATDRIYIFKYGEEERTVHVSDRLAECYRNAGFLRDFNIVDTPGTNTIVAEHQTITEQFVPIADLILFVFSAVNPWGATAWEFLRFINKKWLKRVAFVVQQSDLRTPDEIAAISRHLEQTMLERIGQACPIFAVSAKPALAAKLSGENVGETLAATGLDKLEAFINAEVAAGESRIGKLRSVCQTAQVMLGDMGARAREAMNTVVRDTECLTRISHELDDRKEQSLRQIGGVLWSLAQSYEKAQKRGEELLAEKLTLVNSVKLIFNKGDWRHDFQEQIESKLRGAIQSQIANSIELLEADLRSVWKHLRESLHDAFASQRSVQSFPDFMQQRDELLRRIELTLLERGSSQQVNEQLGKLFSETANWLRVPAGVAAAGGLATLVAALAHVAIVDVTGTVAGVAALAGTVVAVFKRQQILGKFREQMREKRESVLSGIEDHLRHAVEKFFAELRSTFAPLESFCAAQRKIYEPILDRIAQLQEAFGKNAADLGIAPRTQ
jgi:tRNA U34 5-carboxymethylaminomethyl modifying GTPase MnmE/TrmE